MGKGQKSAYEQNKKRTKGHRTYSMKYPLLVERIMEELKIKYRINKKKKKTYRRQKLKPISKN